MNIGDESAGSAFALIQLSYKPLGEPDPAIFNLGVAILLVRLFHKSYRLRCITSTSSPVARYHRLRDFLCGCRLPCLKNHEINQEFDCGRSNCHP